MPKIEPLNSNYDEEKVVEAISVALSEFYTSLTNKLNKIKLKDKAERHIKEEKSLSISC